MVNMRSLLVFGSVAAALPAISHRSPQDILASLQGIDTSVQGLQNAVTTWDGALLSALSIQSQASDVGSQIDTASQQAATEPVASDQDSQMILDFVNNNLIPDIQSTMSALTSRKSDFDADGISDLVASTLSSIQEKNTLTTSLVQMSSPAMQSAAQQAADTVNQAFADALTKFSA
ncbi:hypothetical protein N0V93_001267 [Gnomoniopsis smithogilvyi]|uniref:Uncharacterized protein n=1 Tax=Gnomoniopsis smithogilvyi TaxID=1191159 RepID=A0A9W8Z3K5_9PEZI|nr:hypothetical protein N0V93_001267 [Gnomoniopsis smithogilvyi]